MILDKLSPEIKNILKQCSEVASKFGVKMYLIGGCVRDLLMGFENKDIDIILEKSALYFSELLLENLDI